MTKVNMPVKTAAAPASSDIQSSQTLPTPSAGGDLGLVQADITLADALTRKTKQLSTSTGGTAPLASWYEPANGSVVAAPAQPTLPLLTRNVSIFGRVAAGMNVGDLTVALDTGSGARFPATPFTAPNRQ